MTNPPVTSQDRQQMAATDPQDHTLTDSDITTPHTADGRPLPDPTAQAPYEMPKQNRTNWSTIVTAVVVVLIIVLVLAWVF